MTDVPSFESDELPDALSAMFAGLFGGVTSGTIDDVGKASPRLRSKLASGDALKNASTFAALLTVPDLQVNTLRIEALVHLALGLGQGRQVVSDKLINEAFTELGEGPLGRSEDPPEDVFIGAVRSDRGNYRLLDGMWEANSFHIQRFLDTIAVMPPDPKFDRVRRCVFALLSISEDLCKRVGLERFELGGDTGASSLTRRQLAQLPRRRAQLRFAKGDLSRLEIDARDLEPFLFDLSFQAQLLTESLGNSVLDRRPLVRSGEHISVILPTSIGAAVRYFVIAAMKEMAQIDPFLRALAAVHARNFTEAPMLGGPTGAPFRFSPQPFGAVAETMTIVDAGRFLHIVLVTDNLDDFEDTGLAGMNPNAAAFGGVISKLSRRAYEGAVTHYDFRDGMTIVVGCGVGRGSGMVLEEDPPEAWRVEFISAADLETLCWAQGFKPTTLWKIHEAQEALRALGVSLLNINGLLNLVAWERSLHGHLIPHGKIPDGFALDGAMATVMVNQNSLRGLRHEVANEHDVRVERFVDQRWLRIRRDTLSVFRDDEEAPTYGSEDPNEVGKPLSAYRAEKRVWWADTKLDAETPGEQAYERWRMVAVWLSRAAPVLDGLKGLPEGPILWNARFEGSLEKFEGRICDYETARGSIRVEVDPTSSSLTTVASPGFNFAIFNPENIAERALVDALVEGVLMLAGGTSTTSLRDGLVAAIVPGPLARNSHAFFSQGFRDEIRPRERERVVYVEPEDDARQRLGMGWRTRSPSAGGRIEGKAESTAYLNGLVASLTADLEADLRGFNRRFAILSLIRNHEDAARDRDNWARTASAVLALHRDLEDTLQKFADHEFKLNAVFQGTRLAAEVANYASPTDGGLEPGAMDIARFMAKAGLLYQLGGWSDAIRWDVMEPSLRITPLGDVHANFGFIDSIIAPHARAASDVRVAEAAERYGSHLEERPFEVSTEHHLEMDFREAWAEQFGATFDEVRVFLDFIDELGRTADSLVIEVNKSAFDQVRVGEQTLSPQVTQNLLTLLSSVPTADWASLRPRFEARDRHPWRFRRRLSVLRRPILQLDHEIDAGLIIAPGLVREAIGYQLHGFHRGDFPTEQLSPKMKAWKGSEADRRGRAFSKEVAHTLEATGWKTDTEVRVTKLLDRGLERDFGDVDVLAWKPDGRVLIIECKDVQYRKTYGEIAEQLADFRGKRRSNGRPDYLLRHLDRMDVITKHAGAVASFVRGDAVQLESHLVFKNPVPMEFALKRMSQRVQVRNFSQLGEI
jgi:hypothetical protein